MNRQTLTLLILLRRLKRRRYYVSPAHFKTIDKRFETFYKCKNIRLPSFLSIIKIKKKNFRKTFSII